jgi:hypothetical protein
LHWALTQLVNGSARALAQQQTMLDQVEFLVERLQHEFQAARSAFTARMAASPHTTLCEPALCGAQAVAQGPGVPVNEPSHARGLTMTAELPTSRDPTTGITTGHAMLPKADIGMCLSPRSESKGEGVPPAPVVRHEAHGLVLKWSVQDTTTGRCSWPGTTRAEEPPGSQAKQEAVGLAVNTPSKPGLPPCTAHGRAVAHASDGHRVQPNAPGPPGVVTTQCARPAPPTARQHVTNRSRTVTCVWLPESPGSAEQLTRSALRADFGGARGRTPERQQGEPVTRRAPEQRQAQLVTRVTPNAIRRQSVPPPRWPAHTPCPTGR